MTIELSMIISATCLLLLLYVCVSVYACICVCLVHVYECLFFKKVNKMKQVMLFKAKYINIYSTLTELLGNHDYCYCCWLQWLLLIINPDDVNVPMNILPSACVRSYSAI